MAAEMGSVYKKKTLQNQSCGWFKIILKIAGIILHRHCGIGHSRLTHLFLLYVLRTESIIITEACFDGLWWIKLCWNSLFQL